MKDDAWFFLPQKAWDELERVLREERREHELALEQCRQRIRKERIKRNTRQGG
jgi:hypothetical protein